MNQQAMPNVTLYDLLSRNWTCKAGIASTCFSADGTAALFALDDGALAIAQTADEEAPETRIRMSADVGRATIRPRSAPPAAMIEIASLGEGAPPMAPFSRNEFLVGTDAGQILKLAANGEIEETSLTFPSPVVALDHNARTGMTVASDGSAILMTIDLQTPALRKVGSGSRVSLLSLSPDGRQLAMADGEALTISVVAGEPEQDLVVPLARSPAAVAWSSDGRWAACPQQDAGVCLIDLKQRSSTVIDGFPAAVQTAVFSHPANTLVASGAFRIAAWSMEAAPLGDSRAGALETGRRGLVAVERVAAHPKRKLVAAAYENGQIVVAQVGLGDELLLRPSGADVTALAWSPDGRHLAVGSGDGTAALIGLPPQMFK
ncbi:putative protein containing caspase domain protein [Hartmannibacter diazotrophicus]|uniref:Uncharacterized protein n=1 Tax=Hartmannibacter diazotrophicus TaxID=1482074 RepID=A0A2C9DCH1_9HYPH|nr:hypothetical protein [Hartmannibacter diazotrophicus]SON57421.1 putative protein containing caspase domain protein [Hartmannibacter diazotrophicus]